MAELHRQASATPDQIKPTSALMRKDTHFHLRLRVIVLLHAAKVIATRKKAISYLQKAGHMSV